METPIQPAGAFVVNTVADVVKVRCHYCSRFHHRFDVLPNRAGGALMCLKCYEWHVSNIESVAKQGVPAGCFECRRTWDELRLTLDPADTTSEVKMFLVPRDGIYQLLCRTCSDAYERKRADLLRGTLYGQRKGV